MENSERKSELMKPIILKAGIPLVVSVAGFIYSLIRTRNFDKPSQPQEEFADQECLEEEEEEFIHATETTNSLVNRGIHYRLNWEEVISGLVNQVRILQERERDLERRFRCYCGLKEYELAATKFQNSLALEQTRVEFLTKTVLSMEAEKRRFELMVVEYLRVLRQVRSAVVENGLLRKKAKKLLIARRKYSQIVRRQALILQAREAEISMNRDELQLKEEVIAGLRIELLKLKKIAEQLEEEKKELLDKLESTESSVPKKEAEEKVLSELEQVRKEREAEAEELVYLRWINACFRHEMVRNREQGGHGDDKMIDEVMRYDTDASADQGESCAFVMSSGHKKGKLLDKLGRWVKGSEGCRCSRSWSEKKHEHKYGRIEGEQHRKSCSSA